MQHDGLIKESMASVFVGSCPEGRSMVFLLLVFFLWLALPVVSCGSMVVVSCPISIIVHAMVFPIRMVSLPSIKPLYAERLTDQPNISDS